MLVIIAKTGATDKCINKTHYIPTMEYYLPYKGIKYAPSRKKMYTGTFQKCLNNIIVMPQKVSMGNRNRREKRRMRKPVF